MSALEITGTLLGLINVVLIIRRSVWNYPFGLAMVTIYAWIFWTAHLYSDTLLQIFFFLVQIYGWANWLQNRDSDGLVVPASLSSRARLFVILMTTAGSAALGAIMARWTDASLPWWDAFVAGASVAAQCLLSGRRIENWYLWIVSDVVAIGVYSFKALDLTAGLYVVFLLMSIAGLHAWRRDMRSHTVPSGVSA